MSEVDIYKGITESNKIYSTMVIRSQAETINKLEEEVNKQAKAIQIYQKELQRKDNVINELEKWLKYKKQQMKQFDLDKRKETGAYWYSTMGEIEEFLDKLNELRGK